MNAKIVLMSILFATITINGFAQKNDVSESKATINDFKETDSGISKFFSSAYGYVVFPGIGKGAVGIGGAGGKGTVFKGGGAVADAKMSQVTIGFQWGGQKYAEVIFFETAAAFKKFMANDFEFAAQVSAVALKAGVSADAEYREGMLVFTQAIGGLMYEASIGGQKFKAEPF